MIYLDHSATTPVDPRVLEAMMPYFSEIYGNAASSYALGMEANSAVEKARAQIAAAINASPDEVVFTSGGTESNNLAIKGVMFASNNRERNHFITTPIEHHAVLEPAAGIAAHGCVSEIIPIPGDGVVDPDDIRKRITGSTQLVSVMHANNEIGTIQPISEIGEICASAGVKFHTDAVQSFGKLPINVKQMGVDLLSLSGHKLYGPKGVGALYIRRGTCLARQQEGGEQERRRRGGTLNVPGIVGLGKAVEIARQEMVNDFTRQSELRNRFFDQIRLKLSGVHITGSVASRMPNNIHICVEEVDGEPLLLSLDFAGICASAGSACSTGTTEPSHVITALGIPRELARGAMRLTLGRATTWADLEVTLDVLQRSIQELRRLSTHV